MQNEENVAVASCYCFLFMLRCSALLGCLVLNSQIVIWPAVQFVLLQPLHCAIGSFLPLSYRRCILLLLLMFVTCYSYILIAFKLKKTMWWLNCMKELFCYCAEIMLWTATLTELPIQPQTECSMFSFDTTLVIYEPGIQQKGPIVGKFTVVQVWNWDNHFSRYKQPYWRRNYTR